MDQAVSLLGMKDHALKIDFFPLRTEPVPLPDDYVIIVANSLVQAGKSAGAREKYNQRAIECRLALAAIKRGFENRPEVFPGGITSSGSMAPEFEPG